MPCQYVIMYPLLMQGVDVVVGTPGRIKDLMNRGRLKLDSIRYQQHVDVGWRSTVKWWLDSIPLQVPSS